MALALLFWWLFSWWCQILTVVLTASVGLILIKVDSIGSMYHPIICRNECLSNPWYLSLPLHKLVWLTSVSPCNHTCLDYMYLITTSATYCLPFKHSNLTTVHNPQLSSITAHLLTMANQQHNVHHLTDQPESTSIDEQSPVRRVVVHSTHALSRGMAEWKFAAVGKLYAEGELLPRAAERAAKAAWTHL
ncbi:hypothetical protein MKX01_009561 [Papaver californicum]|nr:hypothetical protein MKX01_009561 [Papaver californicum]